MQHGHPRELPLVQVLWLEEEGRVVVEGVAAEADLLLVQQREQMRWTLLDILSRPSPSRVVRMAKND